jgi:hypothetical protein
VWKGRANKLIRHEARTPMSDTTRPHPKNAPGPFYVVDGCCTADYQTQKPMDEMHTSCAATHNVYYVL